MIRKLLELIIIGVLVPIMLLIDIHDNMVQKRNREKAYRQWWWY